MIWWDIRTAHAQRFLDDKSRNNGRRDLYKVSYERKLNFLSIYEIFEFIHFICFNTLIQRSDFYDGTFSFKNIFKREIMVVEICTRIKELNFLSICSVCLQIFSFIFYLFHLFSYFNSKIGFLRWYIFFFSRISLNEK